MGLLSFVKEAGQKLFHPGGKDVNAGGAADVAALNDSAGQAILKYIGTQNLAVDKLQVSFDGASATATVSGQAQDQATKEKVVLCCGNIHSVEHVNDQMTVATAAPEAKYYTVVGGDTLSKISKQMYGDANKYNTIFDANKPMLTSPDRIYPGQMLRIPRLA